jgi:predicted permease
MNTLLQTLLPVFGLMALGYGSTRARVIDQGGLRGLVLFVFTFSIPALLLSSLATLEVPEDIEWGFMVAFYLGSLVTWALGLALGRFAFGRPLADQAIFGLGAAFSNLFLIGLPVVLTALGDEASFPMMLIIGFHSATFLPLTVLLVQTDPERDDRTARLAVFGDVLRNPVIAALLLGTAVNALDVTLWPPILSVLDLLGAAAIPCALFALGGSLDGYPVDGDAAPSIGLAVLKLVVHPLLVWLIAVPILGLSGISVAVAVLMAAMPSAVFVYLFGARYDAAPMIGARVVVLTSVASFVTLAVVLALVPRML